jgi:hypothetical protein
VGGLSAEKGSKRVFLVQVGPQQELLVSCRRVRADYGCGAGVGRSAEIGMIRGPGPAAGDSADGGSGSGRGVGVVVLVVVAIRLGEDIVCRGPVIVRISWSLIGRSCVMLRCELNGRGKRPVGARSVWLRLVVDHFLLFAFDRH